MEMQETDNRVGRHPWDNPLPRYIAAGFLAISLHGIFLLFAEAPDSDSSIASNIKHVTLLPLDTKLVSEKRLLEWMKIMDPTYVTQPDRVNGFSFVPELKQPEDMEVATDKHYSQAEKGSFLPIPAPVESYRDKIKRIWEYSTASVRKPSFSIARRSAQDYPLWILEDGSILPQLFADTEKVRGILNKQQLAVKETVLKIEFLGQGFFPRIKIDVSCGDKELDLMALKTFAIKGPELFEPQKNIGVPQFIAVKWQTTDK